MNGQIEVRQTLNGQFSTRSFILCCAYTRVATGHYISSMSNSKQHKIGNQKYAERSKSGEREREREWVFDICDIVVIENRKSQNYCTATDLLLYIIV